MLKVFGCLCFATKHTPQHKFDARSQKGALGYENGTKGYVILDTSNKKIFIFRNVLFHEMQFPFDKTSPHTTSIGLDTNFLPTPPLGQATSFDQTTSNRWTDSPYPLKLTLPRHLQQQMISLLYP